MAAKSSLAQYACDHCKQRKLRCSRELPSCQNCSHSWGVECKYSRHGKIPRRSRKIGGIRPSQESSENNKQPRGTETSSSSSLSQENNSDDSPVVHKDITPLPDAQQNIRENPQGKLLSDNVGKQFYIGPSPAATFIYEANDSISNLTNTFSDTSLKANAEEGLSELSNYLASRDFSYASDIRKSVREFRRNNEVFFIPTEEEGQRLLEIFSHGMDKGQPFFTPPPSELLPKLAFEPSQVRERGWLLLFNSFVSTATSLLEPQNLRLCRGLQWNTWQLIEDSSILLEPNEITIQALLLVATHGQDIATPSLCLTLISHACHMAQSLALHLPTRRSPVSSEENKHRNSLFWTLFAVDKALALSFGRQPLLPSYLYKNVPPPDPVYLARYRPHFDDNLPLSKTNKMYEEFGGFHFIKYLELAITHGQISDLLQSDTGTRESILEIKKRLDKWMEDIEESKYAKEILLQDPEQIEVSIGLSYMKFQYHHLVVYLTRGDKETQHICLESARTAISILEKLVSSSSQVYNGIVWQLLYQPFTPFFVLFTHILSNPTQAKECFSDLQLLRRVVLYFLQMHNNHPSAPKLEKVAETFTRLAEAYVRHSMQMQTQTLRMPPPSPPRPQHPPPLPSQLQQESTTPLTATTPISTYPDPLNTVSTTFSSLPPPPDPLEPGLPTDFNFDFDLNPMEPASDPMALLNFFSSTSDMGQEGFFPEDGEAAPIMQKLSDLGQNYGLDGTFDWISWDQYDR